MGDINLALVNNWNFCLEKNIYILALLKHNKNNLKFKENEKQV